MTIGYGERETNCFHSFVGHEFEAYIVDTEYVDGDGNMIPDGFDVVEFYEHVVIKHTTTKTFGISPPSSSRRFDNQKDLEVEVKSALNKEWSKHHMVERTFSSLGFAKGRLPNDVFASMGSFYYNNRHNVVNEEWAGKGLFVNWWETDIKFVAIPWSLKEIWQLRLLTLVGIWSGVDVEETSMYGLRQYEQGARLLSHVDRMPTHAVSLIVNIAQENLASPWPVEVFDHADRLHEVMMEPGDIVYYESAKNLHGRNRPLTCQPGMSCKFVNLFTHYRPKADGDKWYRNLDDLPNRPSPLLIGEVDSDQDNTICTLNNDNDNSDVKEGGGGIGVGTVKCNDSRLGSHISPTLFKATSAEHLFQWWKATADPNFVGWGYAKKMHGVDDVGDDDENDAVDDNGNGNGNGNGDGDGDDCQDDHLKCTEWSKFGECDANPVYMLRSCCHSCKHRPEELVATSSGTPSTTDSGITNIINDNDVDVDVVDDEEEDYDYGDYDSSSSSGTPSTTDTTTTVNDGDSDEL